MPENILVAVAWPYCNGSLHLGHLAGAYLPADIFARYHRLRGNRVLMVSGSDQHGTPITLRAEQEGVHPQQIVSRFQAEFLECWRQMGISFDLFTTTGTSNHRNVTHDIFLALLQQGFLYKATTSQPFCIKCQRFLPDRYVEGTCPHCKFGSARGDQCDGCGKTLNPEDLISPHCRMDGTIPEFRLTEHFFLRLSAFRDRLYEWVKGQKHWRPNVLNFTLRYLEEGLKDRAITRDIQWGIPIPVPGYDSKRIYVWFEAVIGYLSAAKEISNLRGTPNQWQAFWLDPSAKTYYFIGKDNIPFHTIIWPAMLMGYGGHNLPYDVPANEYMAVEAKKFSKSRNWAIWLPDYLSRYQADPLRYCLAINMPETSDADFSWTDFVRRNNDELVATYGNLVHRVLSFTYRSFEGHVPQPGVLGEADTQVLTSGKTAMDNVSASLTHCRFREGLRHCFDYAQQVNRYLDARGPWKAIKTDRQGAGTTLWVAIQAISHLKTMTCPYLPFSSARLHSLLGLKGTVEETGWRADDIPGGHPFPSPTPLFTKLDDSVAGVETERLLGNAG